MQVLLQVFEVPMAFSSWQQFERFTSDNPGFAALFEGATTVQRQQASDVMASLANTEGFLTPDSGIHVHDNEAHLYTCQKP